MSTNLNSGLRRLRQRGDTIVEVMIVLAVLGLALGISYATANTSLLQAREAQENSKAILLAQSQIESIRTLVANPATDIFLPVLFCVDSSTTPATIYPFTGAQGPLSDPSIYPMECQLDSPPYRIAIQYQQSAPGAPGVPLDNFTVTVTWDNVRGDGQDTATLTYRLHK